MLKVIGRGTFGKVFKFFVIFLKVMLAIDKNTKQHVAIKFIKKEAIVGKVY